MDRDMGATVEQAAIELLGPQPLADDLGERPVLDTVAAGGDGDDLDRILGPAMSGAKRVRRHPRLGEGERRAAAADAERSVHAALVLAAMSGRFQRPLLLTVTPRWQGRPR